MSRIYDALRKAERDGVPRKPREAQGGRPAPSRRPATGVSPALAGMDEPFRRSLLNLKNAVDSEMRERATRVIVFTSAVAGEGKTTIAASFARMLAVDETSKILLIDCSARNPGLHVPFGARGGRGMLDLLAGRAKRAEIVQSIDGGVLDFISAGTAESIDAAQPLFAGEQFAAFIAEVARAYDYVVIDTAAVLEAPETPIIAARADGIVLVVHAARTRREVIKRAMTMVQKQGGRFVGTVLNRKKYYIPDFLYRRV